MSIELYRVDERLIHGQVVIGWGTALNPKRYVVVDDDLAESDWEQELYALGLPEGLEAIFVSVKDARARLAKWQEDDIPSILLTRDIRTMLELGSEGGLADASINLGGVHHGPGRKQVLAYLYLSDEDRDLLDALEESTRAVSARDLPGSSRVSLASIRKSREGRG